MMPEGHQVVERAARESYGRLVAWLASRCRDLHLAEDAVADALEAALRQWPERGVPTNPEAWLLTAARRRMIDSVRRGRTRKEGEAVLSQQHEEIVVLQREAQEAASTPFRDTLPDRRLGLLFVCAHPEIPEAVRTPLMLQMVLGLDAARIASAMLVKPATLSQRLVRAKQRIRDAGLAFELPAAEALPERMGYVLDAIYAAYGTGWERAGEAALAWEALWLVQLVVSLLPDSPQVAEALGLYSLMLHCEARRDARRETGAFVPLEEQDPARWDHALIGEAEKALWLASQKQVPGPYQIEASIQSLHAHRARSGVTDWKRIHELYRILTREYPSAGARIGLAASFGHLGEASRGLEVLDDLDSDAIRRHQPYWAVRAHLLAVMGDAAASRAAYERAAGLSEDEAVRHWLLARAGS